MSIYYTVNVVHKKNANILNKYLPRKSKIIVNKNILQSETQNETNYELESHTFLPPFIINSQEDAFISHLEIRIDSYYACVDFVETS